jgi:hypothetical protein
MEAGSAMTARRLPPHGKQFSDARANGMTPRPKGLGHLVVLLDWREPTAKMPFIVIPPGTDLDYVNLAFTAGLHVTISYTDEQSNRVQAVIDALLTAGAERVDAANRDALARGESLDSAWPVIKRETLRHAA